MVQRLWIGQAAHSCARSSNAVERVQDKTLGNLTMVPAPLFTSDVSLASCFPTQSLCFLIQRKAGADHFCSSSPVVHDLFLSISCWEHFSSKLRGKTNLSFSSVSHVSIARHGRIQGLQNDSALCTYWRPGTWADTLGQSQTGVKWILTR